MTRLIIVRHAESKYNKLNRIQGHFNSALTAKGIRQARALGRRIFKNFHIDVVYSSDLDRAYTTTQQITDHIRIPIIKDRQLREIHLGEWEGMSPDEVNKFYNNGYKKWLKKPTACPIPKCEGLRHFRKRAVDCANKIIKKHNGKNILVVTHGGLITALLSHWLKADFDNLLLNLQIDNTSMSVVEVTPKRTRLLFINDATHVAKKDRDEHSIFKHR